MSFDLTNKNISDTFQNLLQKTGSNGELYDLVGNKVTNLMIDGDLIANRYITSASVVHTSSGSNIFGNSGDDTHQFIGSISASSILSDGLLTVSGSDSYLVKLRPTSDNDFIRAYSQYNQRVFEIQQGSTGAVIFDLYSSHSAAQTPKKVHHFTDPNVDNGVGGYLNYIGGESDAFFGIGNQNWPDSPPMHELQVKGAISASGTVYCLALKQKEGALINNILTQKLGVGNSDPQEQLVVEGNVSASGFLKIGGGISASANSYINDAVDGGDVSLEIRNSNSDSGTDKTATLKFGHGTKSPAGKIMSGKEGTYNVGDANKDSYMSFSTTLNNFDRECIRITSVGNVGIGTATPSQSLTVEGDISASGVIYSSKYIQTGSSTPFIDFFGVNNVTIGDPGGSVNGNYIKIDNSNDKIDFQASEVTIGEDVPSSGKALTVAGDISASGHLFISTSNAAGNPYSTLMIDTGSGQIYYTGSYGGGGGGGVSFPTTEVISSSAALFVGSTTGAYVSASQGSFTISGSGPAELIIEGNISSSGAIIHKKNTWANDDDSPSVGNGTYWETGTNTDTVTDFDDGEIGQVIYVISRAAITYDFDAGNLKCGTADIVTANNDLTSWIFDGTNWILISFTDQSDNLS